MEAPFRFPIAGLADVERLLDVLATSSHLAPCSLRLAEGRELLMEQLACEGRTDVPVPQDDCSDLRELLRALWQRPLAAQHPRFLRFNAQLAADPGVELSLRIDVPTTDRWPRWIDLEGSRDRAMLARLRHVYELIGHDVGLRLLEV